MNAVLRNALVVAGVAFATQAAAEVTFYEHDDFKGRSFNTEQQVPNFNRFGFNDRASSVVVDRDWWQVCEDAQYAGRCVVLRPGRYPSLAAMGLNDRVSSVRVMSGNPFGNGNMSAPAAAQDPRRHEDERGNRNPYLPGPAAMEEPRRGHEERGNGNPYLPAPVVVDDHNWRHDERGYGNPYLPAPVAPYDYQRRYNERTYEANVTSVRAVVGPPEQRCWVEREQVVEEHKSNAPGAIVGALIGGILGHQIGGGSGKDLATAGGAVAGAVVGANISRDHDERQVSTQDVQHCANTERHARPEYWDVTYDFRGQEHRIQTTDRPGPTVTVNERGEPRV
jgi:uncharacterized protein YcfJ